ncbi:MAG: FxsA family protein [Chromatiales bacterium]|jgi:UPF0716 protein FxsA
MVFLFLFVAVPLIELYFMLAVGGQIGAFSTVMLVIFTAVVGGLLVRQQGFSTMMRMRETMQRGETPALEMLEGAVLLMCGLMLLLPGFITDAIGFVLLIPPVRQRFILWLLKRGRFITPAGAPPGHTRKESGRVIEIDHWEKHD